MKIDDIVKKCAKLKVIENRAESDEYYEAVFFARDVEEWSKIIGEFLGAPIKPAGARPTREQTQVTKDIGGIRDNQTMFKKDFDGETFLAMFWPWSGNVYVTLKLILMKK